MTKEFYIQLLSLANSAKLSKGEFETFNPFTLSEFDIECIVSSGSLKLFDTSATTDDLESFQRFTRLLLSPLNNNETSSSIRFYILDYTKSKLCAIYNKNLKVFKKKNSEVDVELALLEVVKHVKGIDKIIDKLTKCKDGVSKKDSRDDLTKWLSKAGLSEDVTQNKNCTRTKRRIKECTKEVIEKYGVVYQGSSNYCPMWYPYSDDAPFKYGDKVEPIYYDNMLAYFDTGRNDGLIWNRPDTVHILLNSLFKSDSSILKHEHQRPNVYKYEDTPLVHYIANGGTNKDVKRILTLALADFLFYNCLDMVEVVYEYYWGRDHDRMNDANHRINIKLDKGLKLLHDNRKFLEDVYDDLKEFAPESIVFYEAVMAKDKEKLLQLSIDNIVVRPDGGGSSWYAIPDQTNILPRGYRKARGL